ncbi:MAG: tetratricopeptide repeat protein [Proteobacteria bacterium]|nr:tetratricopeptide repeat protein [Pseudomonadota bacterium]
MAKKNKKNPLKQSEQIIINQKLMEGVAFHQRGQFQDALNSYNEILAIMPEQADALYLSGVLFHQAGQDEIAVELIQKATTFNSSNPEYYSTLAKAYNNLGLFYQEQGDSQKALDSYGKAIDIKPDFTLALNNIGLIYQNNKDDNRAVTCYKKAIAIDSSFYEAWVNLGNVYQDQQSFDDSLDCYKKALDLNPLSWQVYNNIGTILQIRNEFDASLAYFNKAIDLCPEYADAYYNKGCLFQKLKDDEKAMDSYKKCICYSPHHANAYNNMGNIYKKQFNYSDAFACYSEALNIDPDLSGASSNIGMLFLEMNDLESAVHWIEKALSVNPDNEDILYNMGLVCLKKKMPEKCLEFLNRANMINPRSFNVNYLSGNIYKDNSQFNSAIEHYKKALEIEPESGIVMDQLLSVFQKGCFWDDYKIYFDKLSALKEKDHTFFELPFHCLSRYDEPEKILHASKAYSDEIDIKILNYRKKYDYQAKKRQNQKLKIGYLSNSFSNHPGGHLIASLFLHHDKNRFTVFCYSYGPDDGSIYRQKIEQGCDAFVDISTLPHTAAADRIYHDGIDILIDLRGHTTDSRLEIAALRPAPVQIVYLGFPGTSGACFFDYIIADHSVAPPGHDKYYTEKIIRMPHCYQVNDISQVVSKRNFTRKDMGLPEDAFVFCSFNNSYKFEPDSFHLWMSILKKTPGSVLWLLKSNEFMVQNLMNEAQKRGLDSKRIIFAEKMPKDEHLARHALADLGLDTLIYNGHTTTSDALIAGVPVVTVLGECFPARVSASILKASGMDELVANTREDYELMARDYALNPDKMRLLKQKLRNNIHATPLFNTSLFASELEKKYLCVWKDYLSDL